MDEVLAQFTIDGQLPGLNDYVNACRTHPIVGAKMKEREEERIGWEIKRQKLPPIYSAATVHFHWIEKARRRDFDNIAFAKKFILDALQTMKILTGDGWKQLRGLSDQFSVDKDNPRVEVRIVQAEGEARGQQQKLIG